jgi:hypothetical protein
MEIFRTPCEQLQRSIQVQVEQKFLGILPSQKSGEKSNRKKNFTMSMKPPTPYLLPYMKSDGNKDGRSIASGR